MPAPSLFDCVRETSTTVGLGALTLAGADGNLSRTFVAAGAGGKQVPYKIEGQDGTASQGQWEMGYGTVTDGSPDTLSRDVLLSSSTGSAINFGAGIKKVFIPSPAAFQQASGFDRIAARITLRL